MQDHNGSGPIISARFAQERTAVNHEVTQEEDETSIESKDECPVKQRSSIGTESKRGPEMDIAKPTNYMSQHNAQQSACTFAPLDSVGNLVRDHQNHRLSSKVDWNNESYLSSQQYNLSSEHKVTNSHHQYHQSVEIAQHKIFAAQQ